MALNIESAQTSRASSMARRPSMLGCCFKGRDGSIAETRESHQRPVDLIEGELDIPGYSTKASCCSLKLGILAKRDSIWLTEKRIIIKQKISLSCFTYTTTAETFRYEDLQNISVGNYYNFSDFLTTLLLWVAAIVILFIGLKLERFGAIFLGAFGFPAALVSTLRYIANLGCSEELRLDFYKEDGIKSWIMRNSKKFEGMASSTTVKSLALRPKDRKEIILKLLNHRLTPFKSRSLSTMGTSEAHSIDHPRDRASAIPVAEPAGESSRHGEHRRPNGHIPQHANQRQNPAGELNRPLPIFRKFQFLESGVDHLLDEAWYLSCGLYGSTSNTVVATNRHVLIKYQRRLFYLLPQNVEEIFLYEDLQNLSLSSAANFRILVPLAIAVIIGAICLAISLIARTLEITFLVGTKELMIAGALIMGIAIVLIIVRILTAYSYSLSLDFYKEKTVHSWMSVLSPFLMVRPGSSALREVRLSEWGCQRMIGAIANHQNSPYLTQVRN